MSTAEQRARNIIAPIQSSPSSATYLSIARRFEHVGYAATSTSRAHQPRLQPRQREVRSPRANQRVEIELLAIDASPHRLRALAVAIGAPHVHLPAEASRNSQYLDFHENESGTLVDFVKPLEQSAPISTLNLGRFPPAGPSMRPTARLPTSFSLVRRGEGHA